MPTHASSLSNPPSLPSTLLVMSGLSPQVITETLYALHTQNRWPSQLRVFTTPEGKHALSQHLLGEHGQLVQLARDYQRPVLDLPECHIHVGTELLGAEPHTTQQLDTVDQLLTLMGELTAPHQGPLDFSLAGGRKTMSFFAGYIFSLLARPSDRLLHVTVTPAFESLPDFYYPSPTPRIIQSRDPHTPLNCQDAQVLLTELPVVKLREGLPQDLIQGQLSYARTIERAQKANQPAQATVSRTNKASPYQLHCSGTSIALTPSRLALYVWLLKHKRQQQRLSLGQSESTEALAHARDYLHCYQRLFGQQGRFSQLQHTLIKGLEREWFLKQRSEINNALTQHLGAQLAKPYLIQAHGKNNQKSYSLSLEPKAIELPNLN